ncbi:MAG: response regulator [Chitinivibrionales bacterium]|nr:response regulator [Chitinivibrionales bacterium]MBD3394381.1 response regulator [Chitinivibrionales bacterium]
MLIQHRHARIILCVSVLLVLPAAGPCGDIVRKPRVLVLHSYHAGFTWSDSISRGIESFFADNAADAELCFEYMDTRRVHTPEYFDMLDSLYRVKYAARPVDVIISCDDHAFNFVHGRGEHLFPGASIVFCSVSGFEPWMREGREITGLRESIDIKATLDLALRLHPETEEVAVVTDMTRTGRALARKARDVFAAYEDRLYFDYWDSLSVEELDRSAASLVDGTIMFLFIFSQDKKGRVFDHEKNLERLAPICGVPIYGVWEFYLGHGIVGGKLTSGSAEGTMAAELAVRILDGEAASRIPIAQSPASIMVDHAELVDFRIPGRALPPETIVVNRPTSFYYQYRLLIWVVAAAFAMLAGVVVFLSATVARRRRAEKALRRSEERLTLALEGGELGIWDWDVREGRVALNQRWADMLGYDRKGIATGTGEWERTIHPDDSATVRGELESHLAAKSDIFESEHRMRTRSGEWRWVLVKGKVTERDAAGKPLRVTGTILDVTERRSMEEERRELEAQMQHAQKLESLGVLAGGIAHDFNNILTGILGHASVLRFELGKASPASEGLAQIEKASRRAADLCRQLLAYSGKGKFIVEHISLSETVAEMQHLLAVPASGASAIQYNLANNLPCIEGDATQIRQVVMNLITNAAESIVSPHGTVTVTTGLMHASKDYLSESHASEGIREGDYVFLDVRDSGCGMDAETLSRIFDPFFTTKFTGRGLGLSAVLGIVRGHQGAIRIESRPRDGTTVRVLLPACRSREHDHDTHAADERAENAGSRGQGRAVLVVDDDPTVRATATRLLSSLGYSVREAVDGEEAIRMFQTDPQGYAFVLLDLTMPRMGGEECFRRLRAVYPDARIVLSSGYSEQDATRRFAGTGLSGFIQKPYELDTLAASIEKALDGS